MRLKILKDKLLVLQKLHTKNKNIVKSNKNTTETILEKSESSETKIPQFMTLSKLDWDNNEIHAGIIKDPTAKGGLRYQVIEPVLSDREQKAFEIIKKLLITELSISLTEIKSKKDAERRLKKKITSMIKKYRLKIP
ncbi:MAG: type IV secretory pathway protein, partial [Nitrosopumilus sp.]